ncbi:Sterile alpha motif/pointed domain [Lasallia pustulata]|uniref:Sterile alpha motif/pointed domain n=1 Tax=Lasallia pustulata TaxID=136370 RepID=A0A1W5CZH7_9LECA|nr:Sterile alpha motif/pointed domain [Lasallia pustulata]
MAFMPPASRRTEVEMFQKGYVQPMYAISRPLSEATDMYDTEFEDLSDAEEYSGRRSEESFGKRSDTTISSFDELRTPNSNAFDGFNFQLQLQDQSNPSKPVEGPSGPHLFRMSQDTTEDVDFYLSMSPPLSPEDRKAEPTAPAHTYQLSSVNDRPPSGVPLSAWTPREVASWMHTSGFEDSIIDKFSRNDISGAILIDLQFDDLKELGVQSFGQRHCLWNEIRVLRGSSPTMPSTPTNDACNSPMLAPKVPPREHRLKECSNPSTPEDDQGRSPTLGRRRARRARLANDVISPAESASIVAIEQLLPKPHTCSKGENCPKWQRQQRKLAKIAKEFPIELEQLGEVLASPSELAARPTSEAVSSVVASSDVLGPAQLPALRLDENVLRVIQTRDPQENVRQFLDFQHMERPVEQSSPLELFPPLSVPGCTPAPHSNLRTLPRLSIPSVPPTTTPFSPNRTAVPTTSFRRGTPVTAMEFQERNAACDLYRFGSPASEMDMPTTAIPLGPIARDESQSVPPDMRFGESLRRAASRQGHRPQPSFSNANPQASSNLERSASVRSRHRLPSFAMARVEEHHKLSPVVDHSEELTPTTVEGVEGVNHAGWMKKRKTKMLRHEWHENHFRLNGTRLAMHKDEKAMDALEYIDVDDYAVACSSLASNKLGAAFKSLKLSGKKKEHGDATAFSFQLIPAAEKKGMLSAATGRTHHFAVKSRDERIDWMRELMLAKALKQKGDGYAINVNGYVI